MKNILLFCYVLLGAFASYAQNTTYRYQFNNRLTENYYKGPALSPQCATGGYSWDALAIGISHNVFNFEKGCGLVFNDSAGFLASGTYTIEMYFKLDTVQGYKKLIDFDSMSKDRGLYNQGGKLVMYNNFTSNDSFFADGKYQYVAVTRNATSKSMSFYYNDTLAGSLTDNLDEYVMDTNQLLIFFRDDKGTNGEQAGGAVAMIHISNYAMDATTLNGHYANLAATLTVPGLQASGNDIRMYPNPAAHEVHIVAPHECSYTLHDLAGKLLTGNVLLKGDNIIGLDQYPAGMYFIEVKGAYGGPARRYKIVRE